MNPQEALNHLEQSIHEAEEAVKIMLPDIIGREAVNFFQANFLVEGFVDKTKEPWQEVKRRMDPRVRGARSTRKILTEEGHLHDSISFEQTPEGTVIYSDKPYAAAHNEGTDNAGRGHSTHIPKRQFIGKSEALDKMVEDKIYEEMDKIIMKKL